MATNKFNLGRGYPIRFRGGSSGFQVKFQVQFVTRGRGSQSANTMIQNFSRQKLGQARRSLARAGAYARGVIRRGFGRKSTKYATVINRKTGKSKRATTKRIRTPSMAGRPPRNHAGRAFGLKWIRFDSKTRQDEVKIGPEISAGRVKNPWRSRFNQLAMHESGGVGKILSPQDLGNTASGWATYQRVKNAGAAWPTHWVTAKYPPRTYTRIAVEPTRRMFPKLYFKSASG